MSDLQTTVTRFYLDGGKPRVEHLAWRWLRSSIDADRGEVVSNADAGFVAKARPLPAAYDPGLTPNLWVWVAANDPAAQYPRPDEIRRGVRLSPSGEQVETAENVYADDSTYWDYYSLPLRAGVELVDEATWRARVAELEAAGEAARVEQAERVAAAQAERAAQRASARAKLLALGLTEAEVDSLTGR